MIILKKWSESNNKLDDLKNLINSMKQIYLEIYIIIKYETFIK